MKYGNFGRQVVVAMLVAAKESQIRRMVMKTMSVAVASLESVLALPAPASGFETETKGSNAMQNAISSVMLAMLALAINMAPSAQAGIIDVKNMSFESPAVSSPDGFVEGTAPADWTTIHVDGTLATFGAGIVANGSYWNADAPNGTQAAMLKGPGGMYQSVSGFVIGQQYSVSFAAAERYFAEAHLHLGNPFQVLINGTALQFSGSATITPAPNYQVYLAEFTATATTMPLTFLSTLTDPTVDWSSFVDYVTITEVPEPATLVSGLFCLLAYTWRRRKQ